MFHKIDEDQAVLSIANLRQEFKRRQGGETFKVTIDGELRIPAGSFTAIQGPNGCGKTTLMTVLALLRRPTNLDKGHFELRLGSDGKVDVKGMWGRFFGRRTLERLRRKHLGFAPQQLELLPELNVRETCELSLKLNGEPRGIRGARVDDMLQRFGIKDVRTSRVNRVSGGQQQKATIARAIAHSPELIFLDEPTAYLHRDSAREALTILKELQSEDSRKGHSTTVVMITHDDGLAESFADFVIEMNVRTISDKNREGFVQSASPRTTPLAPSSADSNGDPPRDGISNTN